MKIRKVFSVILVLALSGCLAGHADLGAYYADKQRLSVSFFNRIEYDAYGRPVFSSLLKERPSHEGDQFTVLQSVNGRAIRSFDIAVRSEQHDPGRPFKVIYEWTGKGFRTAVAGSKIYTDALLKDKQARTDQSSMLTGSETATAIGPVIIMSIGGFIVGLAASIPATAQELGHVVVSAHETVISYSVYEYDALQRLRSMKTYLPSDIAHEIIKAEFSYRNDESIPMKTEITSYPENTVRTIP